MYAVVRYTKGHLRTRLENRIGAGPCHPGFGCLFWDSAGAGCAGPSGIAAVGSADK